MTASANSSISENISIAELENDIHPLLHHLRTEEPVSWVPVINAWLVTRRDLAIEVMRNAKIYTVDHPGFSTGKVVGPSMLSLDGPEHLRHRNPFERPFRLREVESRFTASVISHIHGLLDGLIHKGRAELRRDYAGPIAAKTMISALGLDEIPIEQVLGWYDTIVNTVTQVTAGNPVNAEGRQAYAELGNHLRGTLGGHPDSSLLAAASQMYSDGGTPLTEEQIISNAAILLFGGIETTEGMISNALYYLFTNPEWIERLKSEPHLVTNVVEETLRLEPAAAVVDRYATQDVQLGNVLIREGDLVQVSLAGANRDPATFTEPDRFDPTRKNLRSHVTFAQGPHVCLGIHLARLEAQQAITQFVQRLPNPRLVESKRARQAAQPRGLVFRKPSALNVTWEAIHPAK